MTTWASTFRRAAAVWLLLACVAGAASAADNRKLAESKKKSGDELVAAGRVEEAIVAYEEAMDADSGYLPAYDAAVPVWFANQQWAPAIRRLKIAVARRPSYSLGWYNLAFAFRKTKDYDKAVVAYQKFIELRPKEADPYFGLGMTYKAMGKKDEARAAFVKYIELEKRDAKQKFVAQAQAEVDSIDAGPAPEVEKQPEGEQQPVAPENATARDAAIARKLDGDKKRDAADLAGAEADYRAAIALDDSYGPAHNELGVVLFQQKKIDEAIVELELAVKLEPTDDVAWYNLAHARRKAGRHQEAVVAFNAYIALKPDNPDPYYGLGHSLHALGDNAGARAAFEKYVSLEKRESEARFVAKAKQEIAAIDAEKKDTPGPEVTLTPPDAPTEPGPGKEPTPLPAATAEQAAEARAWIEKGNGSFEAKQYEEAAGHYRAAVALDPANIDARYRLGVSLAAMGDLAGAIAGWEGVLLVEPTNERARRNIELARRRLDDPAKKLPVDDVAVLARARALVDDGRHASALEALGPLLADEAHAGNAAALSLRAEARLGAGHADLAVADWLTVLSIDPRHVRSLRGLGDAYLALAEKARARYYYELFLRRADADVGEQMFVPAVKHLLNTL